MKKLSIFAVAAFLPLSALAGAAPVPVDEPSMLGLLVLAGAVAGGLKLKSKFKK